jgi:small subunit ribosomal protein S9
MAAEKSLGEKELKAGRAKFYAGTGRRKTAVARVWLYEKSRKGEAGMIINGRPLSAYFPTPVALHKCQQPFVLTNTVGKFYASVKVQGGGRQAQLVAVVHGLSRALVAYQPDFKSVLKKEKLLTRDPRMKERKKYGLRRARRAPQWSKR